MSCENSTFLKNFLSIPDRVKDGKLDPRGAAFKHVLSVVATESDDANKNHQIP